MTISLTPEEKIIIVEQHLKNLLYSEYNVYLSLIEAQSSVTLNQASIDLANSQIADVAAQKDALQKELDSLTTSSK